VSSSRRRGLIKELIGKRQVVIIKQCCERPRSSFHEFGLYLLPDAGRYPQPFNSRHSPRAAITVMRQGRS